VQHRANKFSESTPIRVKKHSLLLLDTDPLPKCIIHQI